MALEVEIHPGPQSRTIWIPKKAIHDDSEVYKKGHEGELVLEAWWAQDLANQCLEKKRTCPTSIVSTTF